MTIENWAALATVVAGFASVVSLLTVAWQLRSLARQTAETARQTAASTEAIHSSAHIAAITSAINLDQFFADNPELREEFYGTVGGPGDQEHLQRLDAVAEMFVDLCMMVIGQINHMPASHTNGFIEYARHVIRRSPAVRDFWRRNRSWYDFSIIDELVAEAESRHFSRNK